MEINADAGIAELLPLAQNYLSSAVFARVERARAALSEPPALAGGSSRPRGEIGLWSELSFRLRRPLGILSGAIDKLLITPAADGKGFAVEIIDFKTNRLRAGRGESTGFAGTAGASPASSSAFTQGRAESGNFDKVAFNESGRGARGPSRDGEQIAFDFNATVTTPEEGVASEFSLDDQVRIAASDYQLQMQAYALAVGELLPSLGDAGSSIISTLHFLDPNVEFHLDADLLSPDACGRAIDAAMVDIISSGEPALFPVHTAAHCRLCNFLGICPAGRECVRAMRQDSAGEVVLLKAVEAGR
jgi:hypothetical protein